MDNGTACLTERGKLTFHCVVLVLLILVYTLEAHAQRGREHCPRGVTSGTLVAYPEGDIYFFNYNFDPIIDTNIDLIDNFFHKDVRCHWEIIARENHYVSVRFLDFDLPMSSGSREGDTLKIYDGNSEQGQLLAELKGGDTPEESYTSSNDRYLYLVYELGEQSGERSFRFKYEAVPHPRDAIFKIAGIVSGTVAAVAISFLAYKFTRQCHPCRKRCCPDHSSEEASTQRELHPLAPVPVVVSGASSVNEGNVRNGHQTLQQPGLVSSSDNADGRNPQLRPAAPPQPLTFSEADSGDDENSPGPGEPPPSYDSIFGQLENQNKSE